MKKPFIFLVLLISLLPGFAKELVNGYIIKANNDTLDCKIEVPNSLNLFSKVTVTDSLGNEKTFKATDKEITEFGFVYKKQGYTYVLKQVKDEGLYFFMVKELGKKLKLFYKRKGFQSLSFDNNSKGETYLMEDGNNNSLIVQQELYTDFNKKVIAFLGDDQQLVKLYLRTVFSISDLPHFVHIANSSTDENKKFIMHTDSQ